MRVQGCKQGQEALSVPTPCVVSQLVEPLLPPAASPESREGAQSKKPLQGSMGQRLLTSCRGEGTTRQRCPCKGKAPTGREGAVQGAAGWGWASRSPGVVQTLMLQGLEPRLGLVVKLFQVRWAAAGEEDIVGALGPRPALRTQPLVVLSLGGPWEKQGESAQLHPHAQHPTGRDSSSLRPHSRLICTAPLPAPACLGWGEAWYPLATQASMQH